MVRGAVLVLVAACGRLNFDAQGSDGGDGHPTNSSTWTGVGFGARPDDLADPLGNCQDWTATTNQFFGDTGRPPRVGPKFFGHGGGLSCNSSTALFCLEG